MKKNQFTLIFVTILIMLILLNLFALGSVYENFFLRINGTIFEPSLYFTIGVTLSSMILFLSNEAVFQKWLRTIFSWFLPVCIILIISGTTGNSYAWLPRTDIAMLLGQGLVVGTLVFVLAHRFYFKTK